MSPMMPPPPPSAPQPLSAGWHGGRDLTDGQRAAVCHAADAALVVFAPAGAGKTLTLVRRVEFLVGACGARVAPDAKPHTRSVAGGPWRLAPGGLALVGWPWWVGPGGLALEGWPWWTHRAPVALSHRLLSCRPTR
eukprot:6995963-Prymnesium_polylepis.1